MKPDLNQMFADAGWTPSEENFKPRAYVIDHGSFYSVAGFPPGLSCRSKSCKSEAEVLEFLKQESDVAPPLTSAELDARAILRIGGSYDDAMQTSGLSLEDVLKLQPLTPDQANTDSEEIAKLRARIAELEARPPEIRTVEKIVERVVEVPATKPDDITWPSPTDRLSDWDQVGEGVLGASNVPAEIAALLDEGETLSRDVRRKLTERLNVELAELKNLRGLAGEDLKREAEIEKLLGLFARLGEI